MDSVQKAWSYKLYDFCLLEGKTTEKIQQRRKVKASQCASKKEWVWSWGILYQETLQQCYRCTASLQGWWTLQYARSDDSLVKCVWNLMYCDNYLTVFSALTLLVGHQEEHQTCKNWAMRCWCNYLSGARCGLFAYGPSDAPASSNPIVSCLI